MLEVIFIIAVIGVIVYFINMIPMDARFKTLINVLAILFVVFWVISLLFPGLMHQPVPHIR